MAAASQTIPGGEHPQPDTFAGDRLPRTETGRPGGPRCAWQRSWLSMTGVWGCARQRGAQCLRLSDGVPAKILEGEP